MMDKISLDVIGSALLSIAEEMGEALIKSSYSSNIKERQDCSTAVFNLAGEVIAQAEHIPMHLGSLIMIVQEILKRYPISSLRDGDVFIGNDPYTGGSTHLPDITVASPVFHDGEPVGFVANIAHHADGSGRETHSIWDEGLRIPPLRIVEAGRLRDDVMELLLLNFRLPRERRGDFRAQFAANKIGAERLAELLRRYGRETCLAAMDELLAYGERKIRAALEAVPAGVYTFEDFMDDDGVGGPPVGIRVRITVGAGEIALDFAGTGAQVPGDINVVYLALVATVYYALKALLDPTIPANGGFYRAIRVDAPEGSIVNAQPPAPVAWRTQTCQRIADVVFGALAPALPERSIAATNGANSAWVWSGVDPRTGQYYVYLETIGGGSGARATKDGLDGVQVHITNTSNLPVECLEMEYPLLVEDYSLVAGSGGAGRSRGGLGLRRTIRVLRGESTFLGTLDRGLFAPWGLFGGEAGGKGALVLNSGTPEEQPLGSKIAGWQLRANDSVTIVTPGAGGYGPPSERDPRAVASDVREEKVSPVVARIRDDLSRPRRRPLASLLARLAAEGFVPPRPPTIEWFGRDARLARELGELVRRGVKQASAGMIAEYEADGDRLPSVGDVQIVIDWDGEPMAVIEVTDVRIMPFGSVDEAFARDEGEGDRTLGGWRDIHRRYFAPICAGLGMKFDDTTALVCRRFRLLHAVGARRHD